MTRSKTTLAGTSPRESDARFPGSPTGAGRLRRYPPVVLPTGSLLPPLQTGLCTRHVQPGGKPQSVLVRVSIRKNLL